MYTSCWDRLIHFIMYTVNPFTPLVDIRCFTLMIPIDYPLSQRKCLCVVERSNHQVIYGNCYEFLWTVFVYRFNWVVFIFIPLFQVDIMGFLNFWGFYLDVNMVVLLIISIGLAVDFSAHIGYTFMTISGSRKGKCHSVYTGTFKKHWWNIRVNRTLVTNTFFPNIMIYKIAIEKRNITQCASTFDLRMSII